MPAPAKVLELIKRFEANREAYRSGQYKEAQLREEFINPFFEALGWDVANAAGYAEPYKDVVHEDALKVGGATKAPDYCFRVGGARKFFVEAKKPSVDVKGEPAPAYQLRRYAWSAKLPLSVLTDFEELAVYDCRIKPHKGDQASAARILYLTDGEYAGRWDELAAIFSREAVLKGSFDKFAEAGRGKKGTAEVDESFLDEIESWRAELAKNIALRNPRLSVRDLNFAVGRTIDRLIFLRIAEDRGIETYGTLLGLVNGERVYKRLVEVFEKADDRYNSGLFHFRHEAGEHEPPDELTTALKLDDEPLAHIIRRLYYPESPYEFSVLPVEILGQVYEQFLGKVIRLTREHHAKVEDKPEVKKAGGVYYTPTYIVDYIVKNTVGKLLEGKTPRQVAGDKRRPPLRVLDPACGSGSFLIGAYQYLLDWYRDQYAAEGPEKHRKELYQGPGGQWRLSTAERKRILLAHIYGVDIDQQAVEVTKLSLLLKVLEGESGESLRKQLQIFHERALPDLGANIKCGNSLIGPDFYQGQQTTMFDEEERYRVNAFDWQAEFAEVFKAGGFGCIIGNPPYGAALAEEELSYLQDAFKGLSRTYDSYELFLLKAERLLSPAGRVSMIIPASWLTGEKFTLSRKALIMALAPVTAYAMPFDVFKDAYIDTAIVVFTRGEASENCLVHYFPKKAKLKSVPQDIGTAVAIASIRTDDGNRLTELLSTSTAPILTKLKSCPQNFGDWFEIQRGVQPYSRKKHSEEQIQKRFLHASKPRGKDYLPELQGSELSRYFIAPKRSSFLKFCDQIASNRPARMFQGWRIVLRRLLTRKFRIQASLTDATMITTDNVLNVVPCHPDANVAFALGLLNSRLISWLYVNASAIAQKDDFPQVFISALAALPIPVSDKSRHDRMVALVERMLDLHKKLAAAKAPDEKTRLQRDLKATDSEIDRLVYDLYSLTASEIAIVEGAGGPAGK